MKKFLPFILLLLVGYAKAQQIDSIYLNLYTDSLKKGTYNYINIDGRLANGRYLPLDSNHILFSASAGKFIGNNLVIDRNFTPEKVTIKAVLKKNPALFKEFVLYVKKKPDEELRSIDEIMSTTPSQGSRRKKGR